jgi:hypothetical protein
MSFPSLSESDIDALELNFGCLDDPVLPILPDSQGSGNTLLEDTEDEADGEEYFKCAGYCDRVFHYEETNDQGVCGRCQAGMNRPKRPRPMAEYLSDEEPEYLGSWATIDGKLVCTIE